MRSLMWVAGVSAMVWGCASEPAPATPPPADEARISITDPAQREAAVGKLVEITGVQTRAKMPTVSGVDVDGDPDLAGERVVVRGRLARTAVDRDPGAEVAGRGRGTYYQVIDPATGRLARPFAAPR